MSDHAGQTVDGRTNGDTAMSRAVIVMHDSRKAVPEWALESWASGVRATRWAASVGGQLWSRFGETDFNEFWLRTAGEENPRDAAIIAIYDAAYSRGSARCAAGYSADIPITEQAVDRIGIIRSGVRVR